MLEVVWGCVGLLEVVWGCVGLLEVVWGCVGLLEVVWGCVGLVRVDWADFMCGFRAGLGVLWGWLGGALVLALVWLCVVS